jgi:hypothetical protein
LERIRDIISVDIPIITFYDKIHKHNNIRLLVNSQQMSLDLCRHLKIMPGKKSFSLNFPDLDDNLISSFVKGYFEGDGTINKRIKLWSKSPIPICGITSVSSHIIKSLLDLNFKSHQEKYNGRWVDG